MYTRPRPISSLIKVANKKELLTYKHYEQTALFKTERSSDHRLDGIAVEPFRNWHFAKIQDTMFNL
jgi:hypothetical protein